MVIVVYVSVIVVGSWTVESFVVLVMSVVGTNCVCVTVTYTSVMSVGGSRTMGVGSPRVWRSFSVIARVVDAVKVIPMPTLVLRVVCETVGTVKEISAPVLVLRVVGEVVGGNGNHVQLVGHCMTVRVGETMTWRLSRVMARVVDAVRVEPSYVVVERVLE